MNDATLRIGLAQISPVLLDRARTLDKVCRWTEQAADDGCRLVAFGEALLPGYPFWISMTDGARFNSPLQKELQSRYLDAAVQPESGHLDPLCELARQRSIWVYLGAIERAVDRGGHSLYCTLFCIDDQGAIRSAHRKLMPTYEERLSWSPGDGAGLKVHPLDAFQVGGLNCWENWMPLARSALYAQGENVHVAVWPGSRRNTEDISQFIARESRSYVLSVSGLLHADDLPADLPGRDAMQDGGIWLADGGSCVVGPDGNWVVEPTVETECLLTADLQLDSIYAERQNFDPSGHYSRPDVTRLEVDRTRQSVARFQD